MASKGQSLRPSQYITTFGPAAFWKRQTARCDRLSQPFSAI